MTLKFDIAIVGSGLTGMTASLALAKAGYKIALIDPKTFSYFKNNNFDTRTTALSKKSKKFFYHLGLWQLMEQHTCMIKNILVNDGNPKKNIYFKKTVTKNKSAALGFMIKNKMLSKTLIKAISSNKNIFKFNNKVSNFYRNIKKVTIKLDNGTLIESSLLIGADGKNSFIRSMAGISVSTKNYNQKAFIFNVNHTKKHNNLATENFLEHGPLASLPILQNKSSNFSSIVWSCNHPFYYKVMKYKIKQIEKVLNFYLSEYYGEFKVIGSIKNWDLSLVRANKFYDTRLILLGDSAHSIHPLAGQGFNLTLKGIETLYNISKKNISNKSKLGNDKNLRVYNSKQYLASLSIIFATDKLNMLFSNSNIFLKNFRKLGLSIFNKSTILKNIFKNYASEGKLSIK